ncbi:MAG: flagellar export chaperone FliS, partial [Oscillospiraceae bacterium]
MTNPYQTYKQQSVMTMTPGQMLVALFDELIKQLNFAKLAFGTKNIPEINRSLLKSQAILRELKSSLNFDYSIATNLSDLYDYFISALISANTKKDPSGIDDIIEMIT